jgi:hypothetical protein
MEPLSAWLCVIYVYVRDFQKLATCAVYVRKVVFTRSIREALLHRQVNCPHFAVYTLPHEDLTFSSTCIHYFSSKMNLHLCNKNCTDSENMSIFQTFSRLMLFICTRESSFSHDHHFLQFKLYHQCNYAVKWGRSSSHTINTICSKLISTRRACSRMWAQSALLFG